MTADKIKTAHPDALASLGAPHALLGDMQTLKSCALRLELPSTSRVEDCKPDLNKDVTTCKTISAVFLYLHSSRNSFTVTVAF